jgi:site-specific DNA recombinase
MMRIAFYVRVSTYQQVQTQTIAQQLDRLRLHCEQHGWSWVEEQIFRDDGYSGASLSRPGLQRLREAVKEGQFDRLLITAPDRLARKYVHQVLLLEEFEQAGCTIEFLDHPMGQTPDDQLLLQIRGAVAEYERSLIAERMRRGRHHKYLAGTLLPWTTPPYGYCLDPDHPRSPAGVRLDAAQAAVVAEMFAQYLDLGQTLSGLAKQLMARQIQTPSGGTRWGIASIRSILTNPAYTGVVYAGRTQVRQSRRRRSPLAPVGKRSSGYSATPAAEWTLVGHIPAIVTQEQFEQVQAKLATNRQMAKRNNHAHQYLLRALVSCGLCRLACSGQTRRRYSYYVCAGKWHVTQSYQAARCRSRLIPMRSLDEVVWSDLCTVLTQPEIIRQELERCVGGAWAPQEAQARRENVRKGITQLEQQIERLTEAYLAEVLSLEEYGRRRQEIERRIEALRTVQQQLAQQIARQHDLVQIATQIEDFCARVQQGLAQATFEQKRQLVELLLDRVVVTNEEVEIRYVIPTSPRSETIPFYQLRTDYCGTLSSDL